MVYEDFEDTTVLDANHVTGVNFYEHYFYFENNGGGSFWVETGATVVPHGGSKCIGLNLTDYAYSRRAQFDLYDVYESVGNDFETEAWYYLPADWTLDAGGGMNWYAIHAISSGPPNWYPYIELTIVDLATEGGSGNFRVRYTVRDENGDYSYVNSYDYFPLPLGSWFKIEIDFSETENYYTAVVDGISIGRYDLTSAQTPVGSADSFVTIGKIYHDTNQTLPMYLWVDDITITALGEEEISKTYSIDTLLKQISISETYGVDTLLQQLDLTNTYSTDALIKQPDLLKTVVADAVLKKFNVAVTHVADLVIAKMPSLLYSADVLLQQKDLISAFAADLLIKQLSLTKTYTIDMLIKQLDVTADYIVDTILSKYDDAKTYDADTMLKLFGLTETYVSDLKLVLQFTSTYIADLLLSRIRSWNIVINQPKRNIVIESAMDV